MEVIDPEFQIVNTILNGSSGFCRHATFPKFSIKNDLQDLEISTNHIFESDFVFFLNYLKYFGGSKVENNWFRESRTRPLGPKIMNMMTFRVFPKWNRKATNPK